MANTNCKIEFEDLRRALLSVPSETEREFLSLSERLQQLLKKSDELLSFSGEIGKLLGAEGDSVSEESMVSFVEISNLLDMSTHNLEDVFSSLHQGLDLLRDIEVKVSKLPRLNRILRGIGDNIKMVGVNIKIKSATAGKAGEGFKALSQEVTSLSESIKENSLSFGEMVEKARDVVSTFLAKETAESEHYESEASRLKNETKRLLNLLEEHMNQATQLSEELVERAEGISKRIGDVGGAMQFHDVTRQQIESVAKALSKVKEELDSGASPSTVYKALFLQAEHLRKLEEEVVDAGSGVRKGLETLLEEVSAYTQGVLEIMDAQNGHTTIIESIEQETDNILSRLSTILSFGTKLTTQLQEIIEVVESHVSQMAGFIDEIERTAETAKFLALNSLAEFIGTAGDNRTLMVLAQELRNLSREAQGLTGQGVTFLNEIMQSMEEVRGFSKELHQKNSRNKEITEEAAHMSSRLHAASAGLKRLGSELDAIRNHIASEVSDLLSDLSFPDRISHTVRGVRSEILKGLEEIEVGNPDISEEISHELLEKLASNYVMEEQRKTHKQAVSNRPVAEEIGDLVGDAEMF
jgi:methyl-accepting chemotaxis protein